MGEVTEQMLGEMGVDRRDVATVMRAMKELAVGAKITPGVERDRDREKEKEKEKEKERELERERERRREREREREREKEREKDRARARGIDNARRPTAASSQPTTAAGRWLKDNGFGNHVDALEANGVSELIHLSGLTREVLEAVGVHEVSRRHAVSPKIILGIRDAFHSAMSHSLSPLFLSSSLSLSLSLFLSSSLSLSSSLLLSLSLSLSLFLFLSLPLSLSLSLSSSLPLSSLFNSISLYFHLPPTHP